MIVRALAALALALALCGMANASPDRTAWESVTWDMSFAEVQHQVPAARVVHWHNATCSGKYLFVDSYQWMPNIRPVTVTFAFDTRHHEEHLATVMLTSVRSPFSRREVRTIVAGLAARYGPATESTEDSATWSLPQMTILLSRMNIHFTRAATGP